MYGFELNGVRYYYLYNGQGDVIGLIDATGAVIAHYEYDAWGKLLSVTDANGEEILYGTEVAIINPIRYRGYYYDNETGFYYLNSRYYDPEVGRFINADAYASTGQGILGHNMFAYCGNNPVNRVDPSGLFWKELKQWFNDTWERIVEWAKEVPEPKVTIPASNELFSSISDNAFGATEYVLDHTTHSPYAITDADGYVCVRPAGANPIPKYPRLVKTLNKTSTALTATCGTLDIANTWTEQNSNTNGKRLLKTGIQLGGIAAGVGVGYVAVAAANCWNPAGWGMVAAGITVIAVSQVGAYAISETQCFLYQQWDIE